MEQEKKPNNRLRKAGRIVLKSLLFLLLFVLIVFLLILTPPVQKFLTGQVENYLTEKLQTKVEIGSLSFGLSGNVSLKDVYLEDRSKDTLLSGGLVKANLNLLKLFSSEVRIKEVELKNITAKIKRQLPDTAFNFQFIVDAFATNSANADTTAAPMIFDVTDLALNNVRLIYQDVLTGNDVSAQIGNLSVTLDSLDIYQQNFDLRTIIGRNISANIKQTKPLVQPGSVEEDMAEAAAGIPLNLSLGEIDLNKIAINFDNDVSAFYSNIVIGRLQAKEDLLDLQNQNISLSELTLNRSRIAIRLGNTPNAKIVEEEIEKEVEVQAEQNWKFRVAKLDLNDNRFRFDNDNSPRQAYGIDYGHLHADSLTLQASNFVFSSDSIAGSIENGYFEEQSGFTLQELKGDFIYASNQISLEDLLIRTPGTEIKRSATLRYASFDALANEFEKTVMDIELVDSRVQVKDILAFAPQLRTNPAFSDPEDIWYLNIIGNGTLDKLSFQDLSFEGLRDTRLHAKGTLSGLMNPQYAGGQFYIEELHTNQTDIAAFTGSRLSTPEIDLPEAFDISGTISGNAGRLAADLDMSTSHGFIAINGSFRDLTNPAALDYQTTIQTRGLQLGRILRQPDQFGSITASLRLNGSGLTPESINTSISGIVSSLGYNNYQYRNIKLDGRLNKTVFNINADINDPNADLNLTASGDFSSSPSFAVNGMIDSIKTQPLNFTPDPLIFRGRIDGTVSNITDENLDADVLITEALFVSNQDRLPLDTVQLTAGSDASGNYIRLRSDVANAYINGQYNLSELGLIVQNTIQPYFMVNPPAQQPAVGPYDFDFRADIVYTPILSSFVPGLTTMETLQAEGSFNSDSGMRATLQSPYILFNGNEMTDLDLRARTSDSGLIIDADVARIKSGNSLDLYNTRLDAIAMNNQIDFEVGIDDQSANIKYHLSGLLTQPSQGVYSVSLDQDSLMLNYDLWTVNPGNNITLYPDRIAANNFVLSQGNQSLSINSVGSNPSSPLEVNFKDFRLSTVTGFIKSDSLLIDGLVNGEVLLRNVMTQPAFTSDLNIQDLSMRQDTIGNVDLQVSTGEGNRYNTNATITGRGNDVVLSGYFEPSGNDMNLNLDLDVNQLQLNTLEGALSNLIGNASGAITGDVKIAGTTSDPDVNGTLSFDQASFSMSLLGSQFTINNEDITVNDAGFAFDEFVIRDSANNELVIDGTVLTSNFINYNFDLDVTADNFQLLNSTAANDQIYYGDLVVTSDLHVAGTETAPVVDGSIRVNEGTNLFLVIPQAEPGVVEREGIVRFVDMSNPASDTLFTTAYDSLNYSNVLGMDIATNIEISKEAIFNVVIDEANGDFLNVRGEAVISAGVDPSGKITMVGNYVLEEGSYKISFNFLQREFEIERGSTITWIGDPTTARLDVTAVYIANTAPLDLVADQISASTPAIRNTYLQKLPFEVRLNLTGELLEPVIDFDIVLPQEQNYGVSNDIVTAVQSRLSQLRQDEGEINKQVFSLLLLGRFVGENPFASSGDGFSAGAYARQSVSKLLTEQLNNLAGGLIAGVDLDFDVVSTEDYTTGSRRNRTDLNVGLSKRLLNDRLKVSVGSDFQLEGPQNSNQQNNNIAGNIAIDYQLSKDGKYLIRFYRENEYQGIVDGYIIETGLSFILSVDYNKMSEIFRGKKQRVTDKGTEEKQK